MGSVSRYGFVAAASGVLLVLAASIHARHWASKVMNVDYDGFIVAAFIAISAVLITIPWLVSRTASVPFKKTKRSLVTLAVLISIIGLLCIASSALTWNETYKNPVDGLFHAMPLAGVLCLVGLWNTYKVCRALFRSGTRTRFMLGDGDPSTTTQSAMLNEYVEAAHAAAKASKAERNAKARIQNQKRGAAASAGSGKDSRMNVGNNTFFTESGGGGGGNGGGAAV